MNNNLHIDGILDDYLHWRLTRTEAEQLLRQQGVADSNTEIEMHQAAAVALQRYSILMQVRNIHAQFASADKNGSTAVTHTTPAMVINLWPFKWILRIAAIAVLVAGGWFAFQYSNNSSAKLYTEIYQPYNVNTDRADIDGIVPHNMIQEFKNKDYEAVISTYQSLPHANNREKFLAAIAFHETGNYPQAINVLKQISKSNNQNGNRLYNDEAEFYLALSYLKIKNNKAAYDYFKIIRNNPNHTFNEKVSKWTMKRLAWLK